MEKKNMLIDDLITISRNKTLMLLKDFYNANEFRTMSEMRKNDRRNANKVKKDMERMVNEGFLNKKKIIKEYGKWGAKMVYENYKINKKNNSIKRLFR